MDQIVNFTHFVTPTQTRLAMAMRVIAPNLIGLEVGQVGELMTKYASEAFMWINDKTELDAYVELYNTVGLDHLYRTTDDHTSLKRYVASLVDPNAS